MDYYLFDDNPPTKIVAIDYTEIGTTVAIKLLELQNQIKILHWQTTSHSEHKALDKIFDLLGVHIDRWVETFMGKYGRIQLSKKGESLVLKNQREEENSTIKYLQDGIDAIRLLREKYFNRSEDSELSNIFDEIFADLNRTSYLLTLR